MTDGLTIGIQRDGQPFTLPPNVLTHTMAILAKKGAGKTYTASVIAEEFAKQGLPFVVLDPVGVWWGIRSAKDGRQSGYAVVVFGGEHGDIPIERDMGAAVAQAVVEENISCIVDLTELSKTAWREFVRDFCRELYRLNRSPRHVFIEEATEFVPQTRRPELQEAFEAVERLVRMGRNRGLGCTLISQRSAQVAKDVLTQIDILIALRTVGPQDRNALLDIFADVLEEDDLPLLAEFKRDIVRLPDGTAWVWSPEFMHSFVEVRIRERETYHAGRTPAFGDVKVVQAKPDVTALRARFAAVEAPADQKATTTAAAVSPCPGHLARIRELEEAGEKYGPLLATEIRQREDAEVALGRLDTEVAAGRAARAALVAFLGVESGTIELSPALEIDRDGLIRDILARLPTNGRQAVQVTPPEILRKKHLTAAVDRLLARLDKLSADALTAMEYLLGQGVYRGVNRTAIALSASDSGGMRERWGKALQELLAAALAEKGGTSKAEYRADVHGYVTKDLSAHGPADEEVSAVVDNVLHRLATRSGAPA